MTFHGGGREETVSSGVTGATSLHIEEDDEQALWQSTAGTRLNLFRGMPTANVSHTQLGNKRRQQFSSAELCNTALAVVKTIPVSKPETSELRADCLLAGEPADAEAKASGPVFPEHTGTYGIAMPANNPEKENQDPSHSGGIVAGSGAKRDESAHMVHPPPRQTGTEPYWLYVRIAFSNGFIAVPCHQGIAALALTTIDWFYSILLEAETRAPVKAAYQRVAPGSPNTPMPKNVVVGADSFHYQLVGHLVPRVASLALPRPYEFPNDDPRLRKQSKLKRQRSTTPEALRIRSRESGNFQSTPSSHIHVAQ